MIRSLKSASNERPSGSSAGRLLSARWWVDSTPLELHILGRTVLHAVMVGLLAGFAGAFFFGALEFFQRLLLEGVAGYVVLNAHGEGIGGHVARPAFRPWLLIALPALGGLACGLLTRLCPEARGGGGDAMIDAFHRHNGVVRKRVPIYKAFASLCTLASGGAGGREGPTMLIGAGLGSLVANGLHLSARERRILLVAGVAAGISAVFRTPLGAALLAVEVLYRDGFESDALVPSVLASVVSYSVVISMYGESTLFAHSPRYPFVPAHLPYYACLAVAVAIAGAAFVAAIRVARRLFKKLPIAPWLRPAIGGLMLGAFATALVVTLGRHTHQEGQGLGLLGGGYGAVQVAISGADWLPHGWWSVAFLLVLGVAKLIASSLTLGSEGSAGDFAPSLTIGGLLGGAFGRAVQLAFHDPRIDPGAFALVGMAAFYGGIAHVPLSALVLTCEMAGNYDLLVPLMLSLAVAFVLLRDVSLYEAQVRRLHDSPVHRDAFLLDVLRDVRVCEVLATEATPSLLRFQQGTKAGDMLSASANVNAPDVVPVVDADGKLTGLVTSTALQVLAVQGIDTPWVVAADLMQPVVSLHGEDTLRVALERMVSSGLHTLPVVDAQGRPTGLLDEASIARVYLRAVDRGTSREPSWPGLRKVPTRR